MNNKILILSLLLFIFDYSLTAQEKLNANIRFGCKKDKGFIAGYHDTKDENNSYIDVYVKDKHGNPVNHCKFKLIFNDLVYGVIGDGIINQVNWNLYPYIKAQEFGAGIYRIYLNMENTKGMIFFCGNLDAAIAIENEHYHRKIKLFSGENRDIIS